MVKRAGRHVAEDIPWSAVWAMGVGCGGPAHIRPSQVSVSSLHWLPTMSIDGAPDPALRRMTGEPVDRGTGAAGTQPVTPRGSRPSFTGTLASGLGLTLTLLEARDPSVGPIWRALEATARPSYFLTWGWMSTWLAALPAQAMPRLAVITRDGAAIAAGFLGRRRELRHGVVPTRGLHLNTTGILALDELCLEHNGLLSAPGTACLVGALVELLPPDWEELMLPAVDGERVDSLGVGDDYQVHVDRDVAAPYIDLSRVRATGDYLSLLGSNTRAQIRRARRAVGRCELEVAGSVPQALTIYDELVALHTASWNDRGEPGAFADPWFDRFHRRLITQRFGHGEIELLRLRAGDQTIGCIYNLIANGRVLFYQSGLARFDEPHIKPGYLCHTAAIERAAAAGHAVYDLLGGDARYKASLSTATSRLVWIRIQRRLTRFAVENRVKHWKRAFEVWRAERQRQTGGRASP
jgi:CelD/BcsL family acetyltransferase involved in cellulose biosynthesis